MSSTGRSVRFQMGETLSKEKASVDHKEEFLTDRARPNKIRKEIPTETRSTSLNHNDEVLSESTSSIQMMEIFIKLQQVTKDLASIREENTALRQEVTEAREENGELKEQLGRVRRNVKFLKKRLETDEKNGDSQLDVNLKSMKKRLKRDEKQIDKKFLKIDRIINGLRSKLDRMKSALKMVPGITSSSKTLSSSSSSSSLSSSSSSLSLAWSPLDEIIHDRALGEACHQQYYA